MIGRVVSVSRDGAHRFSKAPAAALRLIAGLGIEGDSHAGVTVQHRSRVAIDPAQPNLRQVHLIATELLDDLVGRGFALAPADLGENVTTQGIDYRALPRGTLLRLGKEAVVEVTGLRNPCGQIERFRPGLLAVMAGKGAGGLSAERTGIMAIVLVGGIVRAGDPIIVELPPMPHLPLVRV